MVHQRFNLIRFGIIFVLMFVTSVAVGQSPGSTPVPDGGNMTSLQPEQPVMPASTAQASADLVLGEPGTSFRYVNTIGISGEPYPADTEHLNGPRGLYIDDADNLYITENTGGRMLKYDATGENQLVVGHAGNPWHHDDFLLEPKDVAVSNDGHIWIAIPHAIKEFDSDGNPVQIFPDSDPWTEGDDNSHFRNPMSLVFDSTGKLYVADSFNHRIQIYEIIGGVITYHSTIGITGVPQDDNSGFNWPTSLAFDSLGRLYVVDTDNIRVQRCTYSTGWSCETYFGETHVIGDDLLHLSWYAAGITIHDDRVYIADGMNQRVLECDMDGICSVFAGETGVPGSDNSHFQFPFELEADSLGNIYVSDTDNHRVQVFAGNGSYHKTYGVTLVPYLTDDIRIYTPLGVTIADNGGLIVSEHAGLRVIKYDANMNQEWTHGIPGVRIGSDAYSFLSGNPAQDNTGKIYFSDTGNHEIVILDPDGNYLGAMGVKWEPGDDNAHFACPQGVAISPVNQDIYVVDSCNQRIQVFDKDRFYKATLGVTGETGNDNLHFDSPGGVVVDTLGNIYVADRWNYRIQKCSLDGTSYSCTTFAGETGVFDDAFNHFLPQAVAVDHNGNVYVADEWNQRVQVYDKNGAYLTTIGGVWEYNNKGFVSPLGVAVNTNGYVYITDTNNHRIQVFAPGYPGWQQANINGFGSPDSDIITAVLGYDDALYAGVFNRETGAQLWRDAGMNNWEAITLDGFGDSSNLGVDHLLEFNGYLYAGMWNETESGSNGGQLWRSVIGESGTWDKVVDGGFYTTENSEIFRLGEYNGMLYAATWNISGGAEIWRSSTGNVGDWAQVVEGGGGDGANWMFDGFVSHNNYLFANTYNTATGTEIWRTTDGSIGTWSQVNEDGFGDLYNVLSVIESFNGYLYVGTNNFFDSDNPGPELWRCQICDGSDWDEISSIKGFGNPENRGVRAMVVHNGSLYAFLSNYVSGMEIWQTNNGTTWTKFAEGGYGDGNNTSTYWDGPVTVFGGSLCVGTTNYANGAEVWRLLHRINMPLMDKNYAPPTLPLLLYSDDFSNPSSGWTIDPGFLDYLNGEYQLLLQNSIIFMVQAPFPELTVNNYSVEVDVRIVSGGSTEIGLLFDSFKIGPEQYHFDIMPDLQSYILRENFYSLASAGSSYINTGTAVNHLKVERLGSLINLYINGHLVNSVMDDSLIHGKVGITGLSPITGIIDVRFDNIKVYQLP